MTDWGARAAAILSELSQISEPGPGVTRLPYTPEHRRALDVLRGHMQDAGLRVLLDDAGTLVGRVEGPAGSGTMLLGSHQDSVREGGAYDGIMGVVLPILALQKLRAEGADLPCAVEVLAFADETLVGAVLRAPLPAFTPRTETDPGRLRRALSEIRATGIAESVGGFEEEVHSHAAPVFGADRHPIGALAVAAPQSRVTPDSAAAIRRHLSEAARRLTDRIGGFFPENHPLKDAA